MMRRHSLTFRGLDPRIPAACGLCRHCGALLEIEEWLTTECPNWQPVDAAQAAPRRRKETP